MRIELLTDLTTIYRAYRPGDVVDFPKADALRLINRGLASPVRGQKPELAVASRGERAVASQPRKDP